MPPQSSPALHLTAQPCTAASAHRTCACVSPWPPLDASPAIATVPSVPRDVPGSTKRDGAKDVVGARGAPPGTVGCAGAVPASAGSGAAAGGTAAAGAAAGGAVGARAAGTARLGAGATAGGAAGVNDGGAAAGAADRPPACSE